MYVKSIIWTPVIGEIIVLRSSRAKRISLSVKANGDVRLTVPQHVAFAQAMEFFSSREQWVIAARQRMSERYKETIIKGSFETRTHILTFKHSDTDRVRAKICNGTITVSHPPHLDEESAVVQTVAKRAVEKVWRAEAVAVLIPRVAELAGQHGLRYGKVAVRNSISRWGSCSSKNDISLSLHLIRIPDHLADYVILHELCHTIHKNHGPDFHRLLDKVTDGRHRQLQRELKSYSPRW